LIRRGMRMLPTFEFRIWRLSYSGGVAMFKAEIRLLINDCEVSGERFAAFLEEIIRKALTEALPRLALRLSTGLFLLVSICMGSAGCYETRRGREQAIAQGKMLFELHCCGCHNGRRLDLAKNPPNLAGIFRRPSLPSGAPATDAMVRSTVLTGRSGIMPSFEGSLSDKQIDDIIRYLHSVGPETRLCTTD
jgi:mono/diheme cytochrome c family protein